MRLAWQSTSYPAALGLSKAFLAAACHAWSLQQTCPFLFASTANRSACGSQLAPCAEPNSYGGGNGGAYAMVAVLQAGLALPAYLVPHEARSRRPNILLVACCEPSKRGDRMNSEIQSTALVVVWAVRHVCACSHSGM